jgi:Domain of unknown function (DUF5916)/Carbohydrate family 9 binding domain-like
VGEALRAVTAAAVLSLAASAYAQTAAPPAPPTLVAVPLQPGERITVDGRLDERPWSRALPATDFRQMDPDNGAPATERTEVRVLYDRRNLYIGVTCFDDEPNGLMANTMQRDQPLASGDRFMMSIDTYLNGRTGYFFEINPAGAMGDGLIVPGGGGSLGAGVNKQWDGIWTVIVRRSQIGWTAEYQIPFKTLNFDPNRTEWGINFQRSVKRKNEESLWTGWARNQGVRRMSNAGRLVGLTGLTQGVGVDVTPYVVGSLSAQPGRGAPAKDTNGTTGLDLSYNPTTGSRANLSLNTDFAQTEVDSRIVNLTRFPVSFPEKRDFFLEGATFFDFSREPDATVQPFFSRRIGLDAAGQPQTIDVAGKLTGQFGAQDVGVLQVRTGAEGASPGDDFTVARVKRRFLKQSYVGGLYTRRAPTDGSSPALETLGGDFVLSTSTFAGAQNLDLSGFYLTTTNPLHTGHNRAYGLRLEYPNTSWSGSLAYRELQANYNPAVGFLLRSGFREYQPSLSYSYYPAAQPWLRLAHVGAAIDLQTDIQNRALTQSWDVTALEIQWRTLDDVQFHVIPSYERLQKDFAISKGVVLPRDHDYRFTRYHARLSTSDGRLVQVTLDTETGSFYSGTRQEVNPSISIRPRRGLLVTLTEDWNRITLPEGAFQTRVYNAVVRTQFSPWTSLVNTIQFDSVSRALGWQSTFRWIRRPGNDIYVVYTQNWQDLATGFATLDRKATMKVDYTYRF